LIASSDLALALKRVGCLSPERSHAVTWTWEGPTLTLSASSPDYGEASEWFPVNDPGDGITRICCLNWQYILPIFGRVPVVMTWSSRQSEVDPLVFHPEGASWRYVVMPMRF
jgi:DNA polymerase III sliding clamp (beta) subunit (PCNA family)